MAEASGRFGATEPYRVIPCFTVLGGIFQGAKMFQDLARYPPMPTPRCGCAAAGFADRVPRPLEREDSLEVAGKEGI